MYYGVYVFLDFAQIQSDQNMLDIRDIQGIADIGHIRDIGHKIGIENMRAI
jgi:hypothetical protein